MVAYLTQDLVIHLLVFQAIILLILLSNIWRTHRARRHSPPSTYPSVSILVPARDEEKNIEACVRSLLAQDYPDFEILVLDDQSSDNTLAILRRIAASQPRLKVLEGEPPSNEQVGKNWACSQLARRASGELLFFTDADTRHRADTLRTVVTALLGEKADLLTGFPHQEVRSWGERLLVPFFSWVLLSFIPLGLGYRLRLPALSSAVGQLMLFRRQSYLSVGGHEGVRDSLVDDMSLARKIKSERLHWRVAYIADLVSCRMYSSGREAMEGFTKNLFAVFDHRLLPFTFAFLWLLVMFWEPLVVFILIMLGQVPLAQPAAVGACLALSALLWLVHYLDMGIPFWLAFLYPVTILANVGVAFRSCLFSLTGKVKWKGRKIARVPWRWI